MAMLSLVSTSVLAAAGVPVKTTEPSASRLTVNEVAAAVMEARFTRPGK